MREVIDEEREVQGGGVSGFVQFQNPGMLPAA